MGGIVVFGPFLWLASCGSDFRGISGDQSKHKKRSSDYEVMAHQLVVAEDASNLADALAKALVHIPRQNDKRMLDLQIQTNFWEKITPAQQQELSWFIVRDEERTIEDFVVFYREGEFRIA